MAISHHLFGRSIFRETWLPFALYVYGAERLIPRIYRRIPVMAVSPSTRDELTTLGIPLSHISVVYNGVNCQRYSPLPNQRAAHPVVGYLGRIKKYKSVNHLIRAFKLVLADVPEARLCITGTGDNLPALRELADRVGIADSVEFQGEVSEAKKIDSLRRAWLVVNPSQKEGWGITVLEANACGTPVVASDVPGLRDAVVDGHSGYLYPYGDIEALAERILTVIREIQQGREFAKAARAWARQFDWEVSAERTLDLIQHILAEA